MHELSYVREIYKIVKKHAKKYSGRVVSIEIVVSIESGIEKDSFQFYWDNLTKNTIMEGSIVIIEYTNDNILYVKTMEMRL
ncbi:MAG: hydrogenase maturation nickel metallochaperone HypA [Patescibacteria group bacterium]|nr:hydrogenase maturation nickel metallochaperone HypA [Patescibacteria group bacterium]